MVLNVHRNHKVYSELPTEDSELPTAYNYTDTPGAAVGPGKSVTVHKKISQSVKHSASKCR